MVFFPELRLPIEYLREDCFDLGLAFKDANFLPLYFNVSPMLANEKPENVETLSGAAELEVFVWDEDGWIGGGLGDLI